MMLTSLRIDVSDKTLTASVLFQLWFFILSYILFFSYGTVIVTVNLIIFFSYFAISVTVTVNLNNTGLRK